MKVIHIHLFGDSGGAGGAISMRRLNSGLWQAGIDSKILCVRKVAGSPSTVLIKPSKLEKKWNSSTARFTRQYGLEDILNISGNRIKRSSSYQQTDIINFHRIPDVFSYLSIPSLTAAKPAVYTLCDMWAITGHCRYSLGCERWKTGCGKCPNMHLAPEIHRDGTHLQWKLKKWAYDRSKLTLVAKSKWIFELVKESILNQCKIHHIPNGIDTTLYQPMEREECRSLLGIPQDKKVLMFAAQNLAQCIKGGDLLIRALKNLPNTLQKELTLVVMGREGAAIASEIDIPIIDLGFISDDGTKVKAYSAADLFLLPSRAEVFPNVALESIACGTPVVGFWGTGSSDPVRPGQTGLLAEPENPADLANRVVELFEDKALRQRMSENCRKVAVNEYRFDLIVKRYIELYEGLTKKS